MKKSIYPEDRIMRTYGGRFLPRSPHVSAIPRRASAHPVDVARVRPRYSRINEIPIIDVTRIPTAPQLVSKKVVKQPEFSSLSVSENLRGGKTVQAYRASYPVVRARPRDITEIETFPPLISHALGKKPFRLMQLVERLRWWLVCPGRLEFLLWLGGTVVLICLTSLFIVFLVMSMGYIVPG
jgi:hypothetical protein